MDEEKINDISENKRNECIKKLKKAEKILYSISNDIDTDVQNEIWQALYKIQNALFILV